jgi:hypothetical protein
MIRVFDEEKYYCNRHYWGRANQLDKQQAEREQKQWGNTDWYPKKQVSKDESNLTLDL